MRFSRKKKCDFPLNFQCFLDLWKNLRFLRFKKFQNRTPKHLQFSKPHAKNLRFYYIKTANQNRTLKICGLKTANQNRTPKKLKKFAVLRAVPITTFSV